MDSGNERRQHQRIDKQVEFFCYIDGHRFDSASVNLSAGGAFLRTEDRIREGAMLMIVPKKEARAEFPVALFGKVARRIAGPEGGMGIEWLNCVTRKGIRYIYQFLQKYPDLCADQLPAPSPEVGASPLVGYSYIKREFYVPDMTKPVAAESRKRPGARRKPAVDARPQPPKPAQADPDARFVDHIREHPDDFTITRDPDEPPPIPVAAQTAQETEAEIRRRFAGRKPGATGKFDSSVIAPEHAAESPWGSKSAASPPAQPPAAPVARPVKPAEPAPPPEPAPAKPDAGPITVDLGGGMMQVPVEIDVRFKAPGMAFEGTIRMLSMDTLFIACPDKQLAEIGTNKVEITLAIPLHHETVKVKLVCSVVGLGRDPETQLDGLALNVLGVEQHKKPGVFERYVKYLYYHTMVN